MTASRRLLLLAGAVLAVLAILGAVLVPGRLERRRVAAAVEAYDAALVEALSELKPEGMQAVAEPREVQRVANYVTLLWGTGKRMDARVLSMRVESVRSADPTVTAVVNERWSYTEYDRRDGRALGPERTEDKRIEYVLVPRGGALVVGLATVAEPGATR